MVKKEGRKQGLLFVLSGKLCEKQNVLLVIYYKKGKIK